MSTARRATPRAHSGERADDAESSGPHRSRSCSSTTGRRTCSRSRRSSSRSARRSCARTRATRRCASCSQHDFAVHPARRADAGDQRLRDGALIKSRERTKYIPIIFLTAISKEEEYVFEGYSVGAVDYMFKPFQPDILRSKVSVFVELYQKQRQLAEQEQLLRESERRELELRHMRELLRVRGALLARSSARRWTRSSSFDADGKRLAVQRARPSGCSARRRATRVENERAPVLPRGDARGACWSAISQACDAESGARAEAPRRATSCRSPGMRAGGEEFPIEASVSCLDARGKRTYTLIVRDISERKRARGGAQGAGGVAGAGDERAQGAERRAGRPAGGARARDGGAQPLLRVDEPRAAHADQRGARLQHAAAGEHLRSAEREAGRRASSARTRRRSICSSS